MAQFTIAYRPAADGGVWTVLSPEGTSVFRTSSIEEATAKAAERSSSIPQPDLIADVIAYESGAMNIAESVQFLARLFRAGFIPSLQGTYGRAVEALVRDGILSPEGEVLVDVEDA